MRKANGSYRKQVSWSIIGRQMWRSIWSFCSWRGIWWSNIFISSKRHRHPRLFLEEWIDSFNLSTMHWANRWTIVSLLAKNVVPAINDILPLFQSKRKRFKENHRQPDRDNVMVVCWRMSPSVLLFWLIQRTHQDDQEQSRNKKIQTLLWFFLQSWLAHFLAFCHISIVVWDLFNGSKIFSIVNQHYNSSPVTHDADNEDKDEWHFSLPLRIKMSSPFSSIQWKFISEKCSNVRAPSLIFDRVTTHRSSMTNDRLSPRLNVVFFFSIDVFFSLHTCRLNQSTK